MSTPIPLSASPHRTRKSQDMVIDCVAYNRHTGMRTGQISIEAIGEAMADPDQFVWVGLYEPSEALLLKLQNEFDLHDLAIEDAQYAHQRTKIETYGDSLFIVVQTAQLNGAELDFGETHIFLGQRYLLTVRHGSGLSYAPARRGCELSPELLALGPSYGLYGILDFIVNNLRPIINDSREELQELEQSIFADSLNRDIVKRLYDMQRDLMTLRLTVTPLQDIINQLVRMHPHLIADELRVYFRDVYDHVFRVNESIVAMREMLTAAISLNLSLVSFAQNEVTKKLAGWAAMLAAPTLITSWYGMNFHHMPELDKPWAYPAMIGLVATVVGSMYCILKKARWL